MWVAYQYRMDPCRIVPECRTSIDVERGPVERGFLAQLWIDVVNGLCVRTLWFV